MAMTLLFDGHLDLGWNALSWSRDLTLPAAEINRTEAHMTDCRSRGRATVSLPDMRAGGVSACFGTLLARSRPARPVDGYNRLNLDHPTDHIAHAVAHGQLAYYRALAAAGEVRMLGTAGELREHWRSREHDPTGRGPLGIVLAMEGADPILGPSQAEEWFELGLRSVNLVHYGTNRYAAGTGADGPLSAEGIELLAEFERLGIILDATHLCDESFFQALERFGGAVLASHQNCRALVPHQRQFSDEQLQALIDRGAVIGAALDAWMLHPGWTIGKTGREVVALAAVADHIDHVCQLAGNSRHAAIGSDLDGGFGWEQTPVGLENIADLQKLEGILRSRGYDEADVAAIFHGNWLRLLEEHLPPG
jgi:membrane dipeptidase